MRFIEFTNWVLLTCIITRATAKALYWGKDNETVKELVAPDYVVLCDCVYSEANVRFIIVIILIFNIKYIVK